MSSAMSTEQKQEEYLFKCALAYFKQRSRTEVEVRRYLERKVRIILQEGSKSSTERRKSSSHQEIISRILLKLREMDLLNDKRFIKQYVDDKSMLRPLGSFRLKQEMIRKGLSESAVRAYFTQTPIDEKSLIVDILKRKSFLSFSPQDFLEDLRNNSSPGYRKIVQHLLRRGFARNKILEAIDSFVQILSDEEGKA